MPLNFDHKLAIAIIVVVISVIGIVWILVVPKGPLVTDGDRAVTGCVFLCKAALNQGQSLRDGPCLSAGLYGWEPETWVCDIAHNPREEVDNLPQNQCPEYGVTANHFIELDEDCGFIRAV